VCLVKNRWFGHCLVCVTRYVVYTKGVTCSQSHLGMLSPSRATYCRYSSNIDGNMMMSNGQLMTLSGAPSSDQAQSPNGGKIRVAPAKAGQQQISGSSGSGGNNPNNNSGNNNSGEASIKGRPSLAIKVSGGASGGHGGNIPGQIPSSGTSSNASDALSPTVAKIYPYSPSAPAAAVAAAAVGSGVSLIAMQPLPNSPVNVDDATQ
jgi:hypothetical protein